MIDTPEMYENGFHLYFKERIKHFSNCSLHLSHYQQILRCRDSTIQRNLCPAQAKTTASMIQMVCPSRAEKASSDTTESEDTTAQP